MCDITNIQQTKISQLKYIDMISNPNVKFKSEQVKNEISRNLKRKR